MNLSRIKKLDRRYTLHKKFGHTVCIDLYYGLAFEPWITKAERFLQQILGDQAEPAHGINGKWSGEYKQFDPSGYGYRISLKEEKYLDLLLIAVGQPKQTENGFFLNLLGNADGFKE